MRYLLVAADKSSQLPVEIPDEILTRKTKTKPATLKTHKTRATALKPSQKKRKRSNPKSNTKKKRKQIAKPIAK